MNYAMQAQQEMYDADERGRKANGTPDLAEAKRIIRDETRGMWGLMGPSMRHVRQRLMQALTGQKLPVSKCGVNAVESAAVKAFGIVATCAADGYNQIAKLAKEAA